MLKKFGIFISLITPVFAFAQSELKCSVLFPPAPRVTIDSKFTPNHKKVLRQTLDGFARHLGEMNRPSLRVEKSNPLSGNELKPFDIPIRLSFYAGRTSSGVAKYLPAFAHEYGHGVFLANLRVWSNGQLVLWLDRVLELRTETERMEREAGIRADSYSYSKATRAIYSKLKDELIDLDNLALRTLRMNELFADMFAVSYYRNGSVIADTIGFPMEGPEFIGRGTHFNRIVIWGSYEGSRPRDYTQDLELKTSYSGDYDHISHQYYHPAGSYLWKNYFSKLPAEEHAIVLSALMETFEQLLPRSKDQEWLHPTNEELIRKYKKIYRQRQRLTDGD